MRMIAVATVLLMSAVSALAQGFQQGSVGIGQTTPGARLFLDDDELLVAADGSFVVGFDRDAKPSWTLVTRMPDGTVEQQVIQVAQREYRVQRVDGVPSRTDGGSALSDETQARISREVAEIREARSVFEPRLLYSGGFIWPVDGITTGVFGSQRVYNGNPGRPHYGIDIAAPTGTPVLAPAAGIVRLYQDDNFYSGGTMLLDHGMGLVSAFLHLSKSLVREGEFVSQGQEIAEVGSTGRSTGPHLDWRMNWGPSIRVDVELLVPPR